MVHRVDNRARAVTAAGICVACAALGGLQLALPGGPHVDPAPSAGALLFAIVLLLAGRRIPGPAMLLFGPAGTALIGLAIATSHTYGDGAVLYMLPALWVAWFYGRRAAAMIAVTTAVTHAVALSTLPPGMASVDRWLDVTVVVTVVTSTVSWIAARNRRLAARLSAEARADTLTGLANRRGFDERLALETARARRYGRPVAAVCFDVDHFKTVNDRFGHEVGDRVLACFGALLGDRARGVDVVARTGGEEFTVLLPEASVDDAFAFAEDVRRVIASGTPATGCGLPRSLRWSVSAGVAGATAAQELDTLVGRADAALYDAKVTGRDRVSRAVTPRDDPAATAA